MTAEPHPKTALRHLRKRGQFLNAAKGVRAGRAAFSLQAIAAGNAAPGLGYTVTNKTGNSPERNRIRRRLRAAARACSAAFQPQHDYVLVGRREALTLPFSKVVSDLTSAIAKVHSTRPAPGTKTS